MAVEAGAKLFSQAGLLAMIVTCSMAITMAVREPPPGLDKNAYFLTLTGAFFAGVQGIIVATACCVSSNNLRTRRGAAGTKLMYYAALGPLAVVAGLSAASLLLS